MLEYRDNINYIPQYNTSSIDEEIEQLMQLCKNGIKDYELYQHVREYIYKEIKIKELAVTIILDDLEQIRKKSARAAGIITAFIIHNDMSYSEVASMFNVTKQMIHQTIKKYADEYMWLNNLVKIKGAEDAKNGNNRTVFFTGKAKVSNIYQMDLFADEWEA